MRSLVSSSILDGRLFRTSETVAGETPAAAAISLIVTFIYLPHKIMFTKSLTHILPKSKSKMIERSIVQGEQKIEK